MEFYAIRMNFPWFLRGVRMEFYGFRTEFYSIRLEFYGIRYLL